MVRTVQKTEPCEGERFVLGRGWAASTSGGRFASRLPLLSGAVPGTCVSPLPLVATFLARQVSQVLRRRADVTLRCMVTAPHPNRGDGSALRCATLRSPRCRLGVARGRAASKYGCDPELWIPRRPVPATRTPRLLR